MSHNIKLTFFFILAISGVSYAEPLQLIQALKDDTHGVDGLGNPRNVYVSLEHSKVFVSSGDDNALAVFDIDSHFKLTFNQIFKNQSSDIRGLEGASGLTYLNHSSRVIVTGFYDGAISQFVQNKGNFHFNESLSDGLSYDRVFKSKVPIGELDTLGLLGAWGIIKAKDEAQLLVASYMSNAITIFDVKKDKKVQINRVIKDALPISNGLGNPVDLLLSPDNSELYVLGFENHQLTIFYRRHDGTLLAKQVIKNGTNGVTQFRNPQKVVVSHDGKFLYVACSGSNSIVVFQKESGGEFVFTQAISETGVEGSKLKGVSSLVISNNDSVLYAAGEMGKGLYSFDIKKSGQLTFKNKLSQTNGHELAGISSLTLTDDNQYLLVATGKNNSLLIFKVKERE